MVLVLPTEIYLEIFSYIDVVTDKETLLSLRLVNRRLSEAATPLAFQVLVLDTSLEDTARKAAFISKHSSIANRIRTIYVGKAGISPVSREFMLPTAEDCSHQWPGWWRRAMMFFTLLWNIIESIDQPLHTFGYIGVEPEFENIQGPSSNDISLISGYILYQAVCFIFTNQALKSPERIIMQPSLNPKSHGREMYLFWMCRDKPALAIGPHSKPVGILHSPILMSAYSDPDFLKKQLGDPLKDCLPDLFNAMGREMPTSIQMPYFHRRDSSEAIFEGIRPKHFLFHNIYDSSNLSFQLSRLFAIQDRLVSLSLANLEMELDSMGTNGGWKDILDCIKDSSKQLTDLRISKLYYRPLRNRSFDPVDKLPDQPILSSQMRDIEAFNSLLDEVSERRALQKLPKDSWLVSARDPPLFNYQAI
ncbi:hypothetical protein ABW19_dt0210538 [Dactylella cylindrospora]|nr:hypothetical protein ABW19_dt0210538 [Dactylella cylindrospora]